MLSKLGLRVSPVGFGRNWGLGPRVLVMAPYNPKDVERSFRRAWRGESLGKQTEDYKDTEAVPCKIGQIREREDSSCVCWVCRFTA